MATAYVTLRTSRGIRMLFDQSEPGHSVRTGCTSRGVGTMFDQSEHGYSVRHRVYVRFSTNQSTGIAYVTGCTYAFRPIRARCSRILISAAPCGSLRNLAQPHAASKKARSAPILLLISISISIGIGIGISTGIGICISISISSSSSSTILV